MAISAVNITNTSGGLLSVDIMIEPERQIRRLMTLGQVINVSDICTIEELNRNDVAHQMQVAGQISVAVVAGTTDFTGTPVQPVLAGKVGFPTLSFITGILDVSNIPENKTLTGTNLTQGQTAASLTFGTGTSSVALVAVRPGTPGNLLSVALVDAAAASVTVSGGAVVGERATATLVTVNYRGPGNGNVDDANAVAALINGDVTTGASWLLAATGGGAGAVTAASGTLAGGVGSGFKVYCGSTEMNINDPVTATVVPMTTRTVAGSGIVALNYTSMYVVSNGLASNAISSAVQA